MADRVSLFYPLVENMVSFYVHPACPPLPFANSNSDKKKMFIYVKYSVQYCVSGEENQTFIIKLNNRHWI